MIIYMNKIPDIKCDYSTGPMKQNEKKSTLVFKHVGGEITHEICCFHNQKKYKSTMF